MTSPDHQSGTDRCAEAAASITSGTGKPIDVVINIQGDEPFVRPEQIELLMNCFDDKSIDIATLIRKVEKDEDIFNPNQPKVIVRNDGDAIYFSRTPIPYFRDAEPNNWTNKHVYFKHIGLYAYRTAVLQRLTLLEQSPLEIAESLEQNRWIENGFRIRTAVTPWESIGIDTPADLEKAKLILNQFN
jgi:3-deoxy-manno-octulosonate cytidylyltransferase (CMP-KDO synthetase)